MPANLLETIVGNLHYPTLRKVDPNEQEVKALYVLSDEEKLYQATVPATLTAFTLFAVTDEGYDIVKKFLVPAQNLDIFQGKQNEVVNKIAQYSGASVNKVKETIDAITTEAMLIVQKEEENGLPVYKIKDFLHEQRQNILLYLPATLQLGELLNDGSMDDRTHKMEGPMSNIVHLIEKKLSGGEAPH